MKIGLTGGIGSGKTTVAGMFRKLGIPCFASDREAKILMQKDPELRRQLIEFLGPDTFVENHLNRAYVANIIFKDKKALAHINKMVHPLVRARFKAWYLKQNSPYVIQESAILFESGANELLDFVILVTAPAEERIKRVVHRDRSNRASVLDRMMRQWPDSRKIKLADVVIENVNLKETLIKVKEINQQLLKKEVVKRTF